MSHGCWWLTVLLVNISTLYSSSYFYCESWWCTSITLDCTPYQDCYIDCVNEYSCYNLTFNCPEEAECGVHCHGSRSCQSATINAQDSSYLYISVNDSYSGPSAVYCPNADSRNITKKQWGCVLWGQGPNSPKFGNTNFYSEIGSDDILFQCIYPSEDDRKCGKTCIEYGTLYSGTNYTESCKFDGTTLWNCLPIIYYTIDDIYREIYSTQSSIDCDDQNFEHNETSTTSKSIIDLSADDADDVKSNTSTIVIFLTVGIVLLLVIIFAIYFKHKTSKMKEQLNTLEKTRSGSMDESDHQVAAEQTKKNEPGTFKDDIEEWLLSMDFGMEKYYDNFVSKGYTDLKFISEITDEIDLEKIGIVLQAHQKVILNGIASLQEGGGGFDNTDAVENVNQSEENYNDNEEKHIQVVLNEAKEARIEGDIVVTRAENVSQAMGSVIDKRRNVDNEDMYDTKDGVEAEIQTAEV